jgi:hypothetical protein
LTWTASTTPSFSTGTSTAALSVSIATTLCPDLTASPDFTITAVIVPASMPSPNSGSLNSTF